jgi:predicted nucleic acid-binding Zn ribbon protein
MRNRDDSDAGDADLPDESDMDDDDAPDLIPCPSCRKFISEDAEQCHHCRYFISREDAPASRAAIFITLIVCALIVLAVLGWLSAR